jgi:hypothetical protein
LPGAEQQDQFSFAGAKTPREPKKEARRTREARSSKARRLERISLGSNQKIRHPRESDAKAGTQGK